MKISVITMNYNDAVHLKECIDGIKKQDYEDLEYIIVDGGSTDDSLKIITDAKESFGDRLKWISEPDNGLYDALNKGIEMSTGDVVGLMNDKFADEHVISLIAETIIKDGSDGVHGDIDYISGDKVIRRWRNKTGSLRTGWMPGHPTLYLKKEIYDKYGLYKTDYKGSADYEFMIRILKDGEVKLSYIPKVLVYMFHGENSTSTGSFSGYMMSLREGHRALKENGIRFAFVTDIMRTFRVLSQFVKKG